VQGLHFQVRAQRKRGANPAEEVNRNAEGGAGFAFSGAGSKEARSESCRGTSGL